MPRRTIQYWSKSLLSTTKDLSKRSKYLLFTTAYLTKRGLKYAKLGNWNIKFLGLVRSYATILDREKIREASSNIRYIPGLHSKLLIYSGDITRTIVWTGNLTKRSFNEELNHFLVVSDSDLNMKLFNDLNLLWKKANRFNFDSPMEISLSELDAEKMNQKRIENLVERYLSGESTDRILQILNKTIPFYQYLFLLMVAREIIVHSFILEANTFKKLFLPLALRGVSIKLYSKRPSVALFIKSLNKRIRIEGGNEIEVDIYSNLHTKTLVVKTKRGEKIAYVGSATISRSALFSEINHGVFTTDKEIISMLEEIEI